MQHTMICCLTAEKIATGQSLWNTPRNSSHLIQQVCNFWNLTIRKGNTERYLKIPIDTDALLFQRLVRRNYFKFDTKGDVIRTLKRNGEGVVWFSSSDLICGQNTDRKASGRRKFSNPKLLCAHCIPDLATAQYLCTKILSRISQFA